MLKRKGVAPEELVTEIVEEGSAPEKQYLLPTGCTFVIPKADATGNESSIKCIAVYHAALNYSLWFPLYLVIVEILNKYELALVQVVPTSWHNI